LPPIEPDPASPTLPTPAETFVTDIFARFSLAGRLAIVTGASSGIGAHLARSLAAAGADIVLAARRLDKLDALRSEIESKGGRAWSVKLDVNDRDSVEAAIDKTEIEFGAIDILVNNAGLADTSSFLDMSEEAWRGVVETDLTGVWRVGQVVARKMVPRGRGSIINIASVLGLAVQKNQSNYASAKAGVVQLTRAMALELGPAGLRVNAVAPGYFETEMNTDFFQTPSGRNYVERLFPRRLGELSELDGPVLLLASDAGSFVNGVVLTVDGGSMLKGL
jgi:NAD(P)-dependent dehydrogenase (short-subunit alcohol dehydrogenase family)